MLINSISYFVFFSITVFLFYLFPAKAKIPFLLLASYFFYSCFSIKGVIVLISITIIAYVTALLIERTKNNRFYAILGVALCVISLGIFKYYDFGCEVIESLFGKCGIELEIPNVTIISIVGISFYTFQAISYIIDVYRRKIKANHNIIEVASFVSFFPTISSGPIMRAPDFFDRIHKDFKFNYDSCRRGLLLIAFGILQKMVIADRLAILVNNVFSNYQAYRGFELLIAAIAFSLEIYCDFAGYSNMAIGSAEVLGFQLDKNFNCPYFSMSVSEFWRRWHISLQRFFLDYVYIPLGGSKYGKIRKYINLMIVFLISGLWHGSDWSFIAWGGLNGLYEIIEDTTKPLVKRVSNLFHIDLERRSIKLIRILVTFILITFAWIFFKSTTIADAIEYIRLMVCTFNPSIFLDGTIYMLGLDNKEFCVALISLLLILIIDVSLYFKIDVRSVILRQPIVIRWSVYYLIVFTIIIFGIYGNSYNSQEFIYFQF